MTEISAQIQREEIIHTFLERSSSEKVSSDDGMMILRYEVEAQRSYENV
jgi:hypothetical protein